MMVPAVSASILIVEDEGFIALHLADVLGDLGYRVCAIARNAAEAIEAAGRLRPDLVLTDINLGEGANGIEAARVIRERFGIPSCFVSGSLDAQAMDEARLSAPVGFVSKPFQPKTLGAVLAEAVGAPQSKAGPIAA
jgi:CheY-like chemotaxis protein